jgi:membrane protein DedA with SNARE-associated domain
MQHIVIFMERYGLLAVFVNVLLAESGLPLPAYPALITASAVAAGVGLQIPELVAVGVAATLIADLGWFWAAGRYGNRVLKLLCRVSLSPDSCVRQTRSVFGRVGPWSLLFAKFVPGLSNIAVSMSRITGTALPLFLLLDTLGALFFIGLPVALGRIFQNAIAQVLLTLGDLGRTGAMVVGLALTLFLLGKWVQRHRFIRKLRMARISVDELKALIDGGGDPLILDVRSQAIRARDGYIAGSLCAHPGEIDALVAGYDRNRDIIVYCACPNEASAALAARHLRRAGFKKIRPLLGGIDAWVLAGHPIEAPTARIAA